MIDSQLRDRASVEHPFLIEDQILPLYLVLTASDICLVKVFWKVFTIQNLKLKSILPPWWVRVCPYMWESSYLAL